MEDLNQVVASDLSDIQGSRDADTEPEFAEMLALQWSGFLKDVLGRQNKQNLAYVMQKLAPTLVEAMAELSKVVEQEADLEAKHKRNMRKNPALKPRREFNSLHWLASYLMRHNPRYNSTPNPVTKAYKKGLGTVLQNQGNPNFNKPVDNTNTQGVQEEEEDFSESSQL